MPTATWSAPPAEPSMINRAADETMQAWHVRSAFLHFWVQTACAQARDVAELRVVLDYDADAGLLSFDAFNGERRVYGADDWIG